MNKLKLELSDLRVESFETYPGRGPSVGTVRANAGTYDGCSGDESCQVTNCLTCLCPNTSPQPSCDECSWNDCSGGESCAVTACLTCLCPHTSPNPSCDECSWDGCPTYPPQC
jgi:hypothetical protein